MSRANAEENLKNLSRELELKNLEFDENNTCILYVDADFSLHMTYEETFDRLYLYAPLLEALPENLDRKVALYEKLLEGSMLGSQVAGGGIGVAPKEQLILLHCVLDMQFSQSNLLATFMKIFIDTVSKWRTVCKDISEGRPPSVDTTPQMPNSGAPQIPPGQGLRA